MICAEKHAENGVETKKDNYEILWLNEKHIKEGLDQKNLGEITIKYHSDHRKHKYEIIDEPKNNLTGFL